MRRILNTVKLALLPLCELPLNVLRFKGHAIDSANRAYDEIASTQFQSIARTKFNEIDPFEYFKNLENQNTQLSRCHWRSSHDRVEYPLLMAICSALQPKHIFEFGTFVGEATLMFAKASPQAQISTLNIPQDVSPSMGINEMQKTELIENKEIGSLFRGKSEEKRINQIWADSSKFSTLGYEKKFDFIWVDAGHSYEYVKFDSLNAFDMLAPGGFIFWHDFDASQPGVVKALTEFSHTKELNWIPRTSLVFYKGS